MNLFIVYAKNTLAQNILKIILWPHLQKHQVSFYNFYQSILETQDKAGIEDMYDMKDPTYKLVSWWLVDKIIIKPV